MYGAYILFLYAIYKEKRGRIEENNDRSLKFYEVYADWCTKKGYLNFVQFIKRSIFSQYLRECF